MQTRLVDTLAGLGGAGAGRRRRGGAARTRARAPGAPGAGACGRATRSRAWRPRRAAARRAWSATTSSATRASGCAAAGARPRRRFGACAPLPGARDARRARRAQILARGASWHVAARVRTRIMAASPPTDVDSVWAAKGVRSAGKECRSGRGEQGKSAERGPRRGADALPGGHAAGAVRRLPALLPPGLPGRRLA
jgi:hypothetical protein